MPTLAQLLERRRILREELYPTTPTEGVSREQSERLIARIHDLTAQINNHMLYINNIREIIPEQKEVPN